MDAKKLYKHPFTNEVLSQFKVSEANKAYKLQVGIRKFTGTFDEFLQNAYFVKNENLYPKIDVKKDTGSSSVQTSSKKVECEEKCDSSDSDIDAQMNNSDDEEEVEVLQSKVNQLAKNNVVVDYDSLQVLESKYSAKKQQPVTSAIHTSSKKIEAPIKDTAPITGKRNVIGFDNIDSAISKIASSGQTQKKIASSSNAKNDDMSWLDNVHKQVSVVDNNNRKKDVASSSNDSSSSLKSAAIRQLSKYLRKDQKVSVVTPQLISELELITASIDKKTGQWTAKRKTPSSFQLFDEEKLAKKMNGGGSSMMKFLGAAQTLIFTEMSSSSLSVEKKEEKQHVEGFVNSDTSDFKNAVKFFREQVDKNQQDPALIWQLPTESFRANWEAYSRYLAPQINLFWKEMFSTSSKNAITNQNILRNGLYFCRHMLMAWHTAEVGARKWLDAHATGNMQSSLIVNEDIGKKMRNLYWERYPETQESTTQKKMQQKTNNLFDDDAFNTDDVFNEEDKNDNVEGGFFSSMKDALSWLKGNKFYLKVKKFVVESEADKSWATSVHAFEEGVALEMIKEGGRNVGLVGTWLVLLWKFFFDSYVHLFTIAHENSIPFGTDKAKFLDDVKTDILFALEDLQPLF